RRSPERARRRGHPGRARPHRRAHRLRHDLRRRQHADAPGFREVDEALPVPAVEREHGRAGAAEESARRRGRGAAPVALADHLEHREHPFALGHGLTPREGELLVPFAEGAREGGRPVEPEHDVAQGTRQRTTASRQRDRRAGRRGAASDRRRAPTSTDDHGRPPTTTDDQAYGPTYGPPDETGDGTGRERLFCATTCASPFSVRGTWAARWRASPGGAGTTCTSGARRSTTRCSTPASGANRTRASSKLSTESSSFGPRA